MSAWVLGRDHLLSAYRNTLCNNPLWAYVIEHCCVVTQGMWHT